MYTVYTNCINGQSVHPYGLCTTTKSELYICGDERIPTHILIAIAILDACADEAGNALIKDYGERHGAAASGLIYAIHEAVEPTRDDHERTQSTD